MRAGFKRGGGEVVNKYAPQKYVRNSNEVNSEKMGLGTVVNRKDGV